MVIRQTEFAEAEKLADLLLWMETKALPTFNETLDRDDIDDRRRSLSSFSRFKTQIKVVFLKYTLGHSLDAIRGECQKTLDYLEYHLNSRVRPLEMDFNQYILIVWTLSTCYLFDISIRKELLAKLPFSGQDLLLDRLINCFDRGHVPTMKVAFPKVYESLCNALGKYEHDVRNSLLANFLSNYLPSLTEYEAFWYESHREENPSYFHHFGYWVFELGALAVDIGWDDSEFRNHPLYPKDLVDWRRSRGRDK